MSGGAAIREIAFGSADYERELELRDRLLRRPLGLRLADENLTAEVDDWHVGAFLAGRLAGVLVLTRLDDGRVHMRQVCVAGEEQGKGTGAKLVRFAEDLMRGRGVASVMLNARKTAIGFYEKLGYRAVGDEFLEVGIPHRRMEKNL